MARSSGSVTANAEDPVRRPPQALLPGALSNEACRRVSVAALVVALVLASGPLCAQSGSGALRGIVSDESGAALRGAVMTLSDRAAGFVRTSSSDAEGVYDFLALPPGNYSLSAELAGFGTVEVPDVRVAVGARRKLDFALFATDVEERITVTVDAPLLDKPDSVGMLVSHALLERLPAGTRELSRIASITSGTAAVVGGGPLDAGRSVLAVRGGLGRDVRVLIDGADGGGTSTGASLAIVTSEEPIEVRVEAQLADAAFGRSNGGVVSVVTKHGTNDFSGNAYGYFRNETLSGRTPAERAAGIDAEGAGLGQAGVTLGGPIVRDRAHFFLAWENIDAENEYVVDGGVDEALDGTPRALSSDVETAVAKLTLGISPRQFGAIRYASQKTENWHDASSLAAPDSLASVSTERSSLAAAHSWQFGARAANELMLQYSSLDDVAMALTDAPSLVYIGGYHNGRSIGAPQSARMRTYQLDDVVSWSTASNASRHDFRAGVSYRDVATNRGVIATGTAGEYYFLENRAGSPVGDIAVFGGGLPTDTPVTYYGAFVQDEWRASDRLTLHAGLRYDYADGFDLDQRGNAIWQVLSAQTEYGEGYLRDFRGGRAGVLEDDDDNWGPRLGFVFDLTGEAKSFLRGGWGIYHDAARTSSTILYPSAAARSSWGVVYSHQEPDGIRNPDGSPYQPGQPLPPNQLTLGGRAFLPNDVASPTLATPRSTQAWLGYATDIDGLLGMTLDFVRIEYRDIPYRFRANPRLGANGRATSQRRFEGLGDFRIWMGDGEADYEALNLGLRARLTNKLDVQGFYTWSRTEGNVLAGTDGDRLSDVGFQPDWRTALDASIEPLDPHCGSCRGPLDTDARHRAAVGVAYTTMGGLIVAGLARYRSALPYTRLAGEDLDGDGFRQDLAQGVEHVNDARGGSFTQIDLRLAKPFRLGEALGLELIGEVYNLFDADNRAAFDSAGTAHARAGDPQQGEQRLVQLGARLTF